MKELNEKELKRLLEEQLEQDGEQRSPGNDDDAALYRLLFTAPALTKITKPKRANWGPRYTLPNPTTWPI